MSYLEDLTRYLEVIYPFKEGFLNSRVEYIKQLPDDPKSGELRSEICYKLIFISLGLGHKAVAQGFKENLDRIGRKPRPRLFRWATEDEDEGNQGNRFKCHVFIASYKYDPDKHLKDDQNVPLKDLDSGLISLSRHFEINNVIPHLYVDTGNEIYCFWSVEDELAVKDTLEYMDISQALFFAGRVELERPNYTNEMQNPNAAIGVVGHDYYNPDTEIVSTLKIIDTKSRGIRTAKELYTLEYLRRRIGKFLGNDITQQYGIEFDDRTYGYRILRIAAKTLAFVRDPEKLTHWKTKFTYKNLEAKERYIIRLLLSHGFVLSEILQFFEDNVPVKESIFHALKSDIERELWLRDRCNSPNYLPPNYKAMMLEQKYPFATASKKRKYPKVDKTGLVHWINRHFRDEFEDDFRKDSKLVRIWNGKYWQVAGIFNTKAYLADKFDGMGFGLPINMLEEVFSRTKARQKHFLPMGHPGLSRRSSRFRDNIAIPFNNGTLNILPRKTGDKRFVFKKDEFDRYDYAIFGLNVDFDYSMVNTEDYKNGWIYQKHLKDFFDDDSRRILRMFLGSCLIPGLHHQQALFIVGEGNDGKSLLAKTFTAMFDDYTGSNVLVGNWFKDFLHAPLLESVVNHSDEQVKYRTHAAVFRIVIANGEMQINRKHQDPEDGVMHAKHIFTVNSVPQGKIQRANIRRILMIPVIKTVPQGEVDNTFEIDYFEDNRSLIAFALQGIVELIEAELQWSLPQPPADDPLRQEYLGQTYLGRFVQDCLDYDKKKKAWISTARLHAVYTYWLNVDGTPYNHKRRKVTKQDLSRRLKEQFTAMPEWAGVEGGKNGNHETTNKKVKGWVHLKLQPDFADILPSEKPEVLDLIEDSSLHILEDSTIQMMTSPEYKENDEGNDE